MFTHRAWFQVGSIATILTAGCASPIHIVTPGAGMSLDPVPQVVVQFTNNFNPAEAWGIDLDGAAITGFSPAPAPLGTSTAPLVYSLTPWQHTIKTNATCGAFCVYNSEEVKFTPPKLFYNGTNVASARDLKQFQATAVFVGVQFDRSVPINVTVVETSSPKRVKLGLSASSFLPAGTPLNVTIPATSTKGDFFIMGDSLGLYTLEFTAAGVTPGGGSGTVKP